MIQFTPEELRLIKRLRKQDRQWRWARWGFLAAGILCAALCVGWGYLLSMFVRGPSHSVDSDGVFAFALIWTKCCMYFFFSIWFFVLAAVKWHGDVTRMLLLRLLDEQEKKAKDGDAAKY